MSATWPSGVIARYLTAAGATVDLTERIGYFEIEHPTETHAECRGCGANHTVEWGWDPHHAHFGHGPQPDFDEHGRFSTPRAREWAQDHAATCRAVPKPDGAM